MLVPVRTSVGLCWHNSGTQTVSTKSSCDMLKALKNALADVWSISPLSDCDNCSDEGLMLKTSANTFFTEFSIFTSTACNCYSLCSPWKWVTADLFWGVYVALHQSKALSQSHLLETFKCLPLLFSIPLSSPLMQTNTSFSGSKYYVVPSCW